MAIEIVDLPINSMVIFHAYVSLPEGIGYLKIYCGYVYISIYCLDVIIYIYIYMGVVVGQRPNWCMTLFITSNVGKTMS